MKTKLWENIPADRGGHGSQVQTVPLPLFIPLLSSFITQIQFTFPSFLLAFLLPLVYRLVSAISVLVFHRGDGGVSPGRGRRLELVREPGRGAAAVEGRVAEGQGLHGAAGSLGGERGSTSGKDSCGKAKGSRKKKQERKTVKKYTIDDI